MGHWNSGGMGCQLGMSVPAVRAVTWRGLDGTPGWWYPSGNDHISHLGEKEQIIFKHTLDYGYVSYPWRVTVWHFFFGMILREIFDSLLEKTTEELLSLTQCQSLGNRLKYMDGHEHCNYVWSLGKVELGNTTATALPSIGQFLLGALC